MTLRQFQERALTQFTREITDIFFCFIENDKDLLQEYQRVIGRDGDLDTTNKKLGEAVKSWFRLENGNENRNPKSKLIRSYTEHIRR
jgi:hypothetical protein